MNVHSSIELVKVWLKNSFVKRPPKRYITSANPQTLTVA